MRRLGFALAALCLSSVVLFGCSKPAPRVEPPAETPAKPTPVAVTSNNADPAPPKPAPPVPSDRQEKYDAAFREALRLSAEQKLAEALAALEAAKAIQDTAEVKQEIERIKARLDQDAAAERAAQDIQILLTSGQPEEAARLAAAALVQFGQTAAADKLARLKRQADALVGVQLDDPKARGDRFRKEADAAVKANDLRAAVLALELALQAGDDADLRRQHEEIVKRLGRYDDNRQRAAELRRDPVNLEEALAVLQEAAKAWDTLQVRQEIDECNLALQRRRDRLSVADFEVRGEIGIPLAGRTVADELLPHFKARFDLVERAQLDPILDELKLPAGDLGADAAGQREVGRVARVRYLVVGSITRANDITVHARLVEVPSGLVVQTGKIVSRTPEQMRLLLPQLAQLLMMNDEEKLALEARLAEQAKVDLAPANEVVPPAPEPPAPERPVPPPIVANAPRPPDLGNLKPQDFDQFQPVPPQAQMPAPPVVVFPSGDPFRLRLLQTSILLGDNLFLRGRFRDAFVQYNFALSLFPGNPEVLIRLDRVRPFLPPAPIGIFPVRPRLAILNFLVVGDPRFVPPGLGLWTPDGLAPYFYPYYDVVDRGEVFWYMARLGLTVRDLRFNPLARIWLARAMGVRFFLFGTIRQVASFDVTTHLVDAEYGFQYGSGRIHVHDPFELRLRLGELARQTLMSPDERGRFLRDVGAFENLFVEARRRHAAREFAFCITTCRKALVLRPDSIAILNLLHDAERHEHLHALEDARRRDFDRHQVLLRDQQTRQRDLVRDLEAARVVALRVDPDDAERRRRELQREKAHDQLVTQARLALAQKDYARSVQLFESAVAMKSSDEGFRELARARALLDESKRALSLKEKARLEAELRKQKEKELEAVRIKLADERRKKEAEEQARKKLQDERDQAEYTRLLDQGKKLLAEKKYESAVVALEGARALRRTEEVSRLLAQAQVDQARILAQKRSDKEKADLERRLAEEKARREKAEAEAKLNQDRYAKALQLAQEAMKEKRYGQAVTNYQEAVKLFRTDAALNGLRLAEQAQAQEQARALADKKKKADEEKRKTDFQKLWQEGKAAVAAKQFDKAIQSFKQANQLVPGNVDLLADLSRAEQAREQALVASRTKPDPKVVVKKPDLPVKKPDEDKTKVELQKALAAARSALAKRDAAAAAKAIAAAVQLAPNDPDVKQVQKDLDQLRASLQAEADKKKQTEFQNLVKTARAHLAAKRFDDAQKALNDANRLQPGDPTVAQLLKDVAKARIDAKTAAEAEAKRKQEYAKQMAQGNAAMNAKRYADAVQAFGQALKLVPGDAAAARELKEAQRLLQDSAKPPPDKKQVQFNQHMDVGRRLLNAKKFKEAAREFEAALKINPNDADAKRLLGLAKKGK